MARIATLAFLVTSAAGCATQGRVQELESEDFEVKGRSVDGTIGLNEKQQVIIKSERSAEDELRVQEMVNEKLQDELRRELAELRSCRQDLADPRLGGDGSVAPIRAIDDMRPVANVREEMGLDEDGNLKVVRQQSFDEKLKGERRLEASLRSMLVAATEHREACMRQLGIVRVRHGLPPERYQAEGYFTSDGTWVETKKGESGLSDAFEIEAKSRTKAGH